jgi:hypothetical protein
MRAFIEAHRLETVAGDSVRALTPMLVTGSRGSVPAAARGELARGFEGLLCQHLFADGTTRRESTIVATQIAESVAYVPALVCRDRGEIGAAAPAQLPAERWAETKLESEGFDRRYRLLTLAGQDPGWVRELFSPTLIAWLTDAAPPGLSFELNQGNFAVALPGRLDDRQQLERLAAAARELAARVRSEALEEEFDPDLFDESEEIAAIETVLPVIGFREPPASAQDAVAAYRAVAARKPTVLLAAALWALVATVAVAVASWALFGPIGALIAAPSAAVGAFGVARLLYASRYRWGTASVSRVGLEAFVREYARSREFELRDRWRFHSDHRGLPLPGFADHVLAGEVPGAGVDGLFVMFGDAAELRSEGLEVAMTTDRPLASNAIVVDLERPATPGAVAGLELPPKYSVELSGSRLIVWRPITGNLMRTAVGSDRFRARAGGVVARAIEASGRSG